MTVIVDVYAELNGLIERTKDARNEIQSIYDEMVGVNKRITGILHDVTSYRVAREASMKSVKTKQYIAILEQILSNMDVLVKEMV